MNKAEKRAVYLLGLTSMINDTSSEAIYAILPYYVDNPALIGLFGGLFNGLGNILKVFSGYLSDRLGERKRLVVLGYFISAVGKTLMGVVSLPLLPLMIVLDRLGKGIRDSPRDAILASLRQRGYAFGVHRAFDTAGALLGTLLAYVMLNYLGEYQTAMLIAGAIAFLSIIPLLFLPRFRTERKKESFTSSLVHLSSGVKHFLVPSLLFGFAFVSPMLFISGSKEELATNAILLYALYNISYILSSLYLGKRSDVYGRKKVIAVGALVTALAFISMYLASAYHMNLLFLAAFVLYGAGVGAFQPAAFAYVGDLAKSKGTAMGAFQSVYGLAVLVSSTVFGVLLSAFGPLAFLVYAIIPVLATLTV